MKRQFFAVPLLLLFSSGAWSHSPLSIHNPNPYQINGNAHNPNLPINPQLHNNHYYGHFNDNPSLSPLYRHHHESPYSAHHHLHGIGSPYTPYSTPGPYGTHSNPYAPDLFNNPYNPGNIVNPYGVYGRPYSISGQQLYNNPHSYHGNFINNPYSPNFPLPLYGPYDNPYPQNRFNDRQMNR